MRRFLGPRKGRSIPFRSHVKSKVDRRRTKKVKIFKGAYRNFVNVRETNIRLLIQQIIFKHGKKTLASKLVNQIFLAVKKRFRRKNSNKFILALVLKLRPLVVFRSKRLGSIIHKIPVHLYSSKSVRLLLRWLKKLSYKKGKSYLGNFVEELTLLSGNKGAVYKKRVEIHKLALIGEPYLKYLRREQ
jgi:ribosomal protein S7